MPRTAVSLCIALALVEGPNAHRRDLESAARIGRESGQRRGARIVIDKQARGTPAEPFVVPLHRFVSLDPNRRKDLAYRFLDAPKIGLASRLEAREGAIAFARAIEK
jgi:hypothetical protein